MPSCSAGRSSTRSRDEDTSTAHLAWRELAGSLDIRVVDESLGEAARQVAARGAVRGLDAIYLSAADELDDPAAPVGLLSFDVRQRAAALAEGLAVLPAVVADEVVEPP